MNLWELAVVALENIRNNKMRSFLTTLGIVIGIAAVITVVAIGQGGRTVLMEELEKFGTNIFRIYVKYNEDTGLHPPDLQMTDIAMIKQMVPEVKYLVP
jgi:putative ABC transport system permease protein